MRLRSFTTWDLVVIVLLGVVFGVLNAQFSALWVAMSGIGGRMFANIIFGVFYVSNVLAILIVRKPGSSLLNGIILGVIQVLAGSPLGIYVLALTTAQGLGIDVGFALFRYKRWDWVATAVAAFMVAPFHYVVSGIYNRFWELPYWNIPVALLGYIEGVFVAGIGAYLIARALAATGVLNGFPIADERKETAATA